MKQTIVCLCLINCMVLVATGTDATVTNAVSVNDSELGEVMKRFAMINQFDPKGLSESEIILGYAKNRGIPINTVVRIAQTIAEEGLGQLEDGSSINRDAQLTQCKVMLILLGATGDASALPFLEAKSTSTNSAVRQSASLSVINLLGTDSVNFIRKAANDGRHSRIDMYGMFESFGFQIQVAKKKNPKVNLDEAVGFLLGIADNEEKGDTAKLFDQILCRNLDGYATSTQREQIASRFSQNGPEHFRPYFKEIMSEIEKVPVNKRANFNALMVSGGNLGKTDLIQPEEKR